MIACGALAADVRAIARRRGWDIDVHPIDALLHNHPDRIAPAVERAIARCAGATTRSPSPTPTAAATARSTRCWTRRHPAAAGRPLLRRVRARRGPRARSSEEPGTYFLTDFLARTFEHTVVRELGLDRHPELRDDYFRNYTRVLWLAQRPTPATRAAAQRAAERIGLPLHELAVGNRGSSASSRRWSRRRHVLTRRVPRRHADHRRGSTQVRAPVGGPQRLGLAWPQRDVVV